MGISLSNHGNVFKIHVNPLLNIWATADLPTREGSLVERAWETRLCHVPEKSVKSVVSVREAAAERDLERTYCEPRAALNVPICGIDIYPLVGTQAVGSDNSECYDVTDTRFRSQTLGASYCDCWGFND